ncbi:Carbon-nitrogen hydrolase [Xylographa trunciseda]|nr:Carbon-nitrogen hydrolase [Xylographa trunciseda]
MHIATLQFSPLLGEVERNIARADELLAAANTEGLDLLVLPELAFTGYNFPSRAAITPHLEPTASGPTAAWAIRTALRLHCTVCVGYPELAVAAPLTPTTPPPTSPLPPSPTPLPPGAVPAPLHTHPPAHNTLLLASRSGSILLNYRKTHLYYTDATWASPGPAGFQTLDLPLGGAAAAVRTAPGICMDLNPHRFLAPWAAFEFAAHARAARCRLVVLSMAWLTRLGREELGWAAEREQPARSTGEEAQRSPPPTDENDDDNDDDDTPLRLRPDADTQAYWVSRLQPLVAAAAEEEEEEVVVVCANRCGVEGGAAGGAEEARYAGSSTVMRVGGGVARVWGCLGRGEEGVLRVDTGREGPWVGGWVLRGGEGDGEDGEDGEGES